MLHQGQCLACGKRCKATVPADQGSGYGPRLTGFVGEIAGIVGASRSVVQDLCTSVFGIPHIPHPPGFDEYIFPGQMLEHRSVKLRYVVYHARR